MVAFEAINKKVVLSKVFSVDKGLEKILLQWNSAASVSRRSE